MRVLLISHRFPPKHSAGTEVYTAELGTRLVGRGHEVVVFTTDKDIGRADLSVHERTHSGLRVIELTNNLFHEDFEETWRHAEVERLFAETLEELRPDVVHFHHLLHLSVGCLRIAAERGVPVLFTLHDFWLVCPRLGQLVHADNSLCHTVDFARCGTCLPTYKWRQTDLERRAGRAIARVRATTGVNLGPLARGAQRLAAGRGGETEGDTSDNPGESAEQAFFETAARERAGALLEASLAHVDRFVAPSRFLEDRFIAEGVPAERIVHIPTGVDLDAFGATQELPRGTLLRVVFLGSLVPLKGAHVLLEAWSRLAPEDRARGELTFRGPSSHAPEYVARLEHAAKKVGAILAGPASREEVPHVLAAADLLVVPSLWFENRPLVLLEALATRTPILATDLGGMVELVDEGVTGWRFPVGDVDALAGRLRMLLRDPTRLEDLYPRDHQPPSLEEMTDAQVALYEEVLESKQ